MSRCTARLRGRCLTLAIGATVIVGSACSDIPSDPKTPFAIELNRAPSPSVVLGTAMFDSIGIVTPLKAIVYNSKGDVIAGAAVSYHVVPRDTIPLVVDATTGQITGKSDPRYAAHTARVYAQAGSLQSQPITVTVTRRADALVAAGPLEDSLPLRFTSLDSLPVSPAFSVRVRHAPAAPETAADSTVPAYLVRFKIVQPSGVEVNDTAYVTLTNGDHRRSELDTTDASGVASRQVRVRRTNFPFAKAADANGIIHDTILVRASAYRDGPSLVPGSGLQFRLIITARKP